VKASTGKEYRRNLQRFILPALGQLTVTGVTRADVAKFHHDLRHIPYQANRCLEVMSKMFSLCEMWGLRPDGSNPRKHIRKYPEEKRERFMSAAELRRIGEVLREMEAEGVELPSFQSSRSAGTAGRAKKTARPRSPATKPCVPPGTMAGRSGSDGRDTMSEAGSRPTLSWFEDKPLPGNGCSA
jgi:hypothetical protein